MDDIGKQVLKDPGLKDNPELSAIITCYYEEQTIDTFYQRLSAALESLGVTYEIIIVNDGSTDGTFEKLKRIFDNDEKVTAVIDLFKNSGQSRAITCGLRHSSGDIILMMDSDLQLDPEELPMLLEEYRKGYDIVSGYRKSRRDSFFRILPSMIANMIMRKVSKRNMRDFGCTFKLVNGKLFRGFEFGPYKPFSLVHLIANAGTVAEVPVTHHEREFGKSGWTFKKLFAFNMDNMIWYSEMPFQYLIIFGFILTTLFFLRIAFAKFMPEKILDVVTNGLILNVIVMTFLATIFILGIIGEFTIRSFSIISQYPSYIEKEIRKRP